MKKKKKTISPKFEAIKVGKEEKLLLYFPDLNDFQVLLSIKEKASKVFGEKNVLVVMGNMKVTKVEGI